MKIEVKNVTKSYNGRMALKNVKIEFTQGIYGLLGPNGAGKSTLLNLLTDNIKRTSGEILYDGMDIISMGKDYRKLLGYMPQQQRMYDNFSVAMFLEYIGKLKGISKKN